MNINKRDHTRHEPSTCWILGHSDLAWLSETSPSFKLPEMLDRAVPLEALAVVALSSDWNASPVEACQIVGYWSGTLEFL